VSGVGITKTQVEMSTAFLSSVIVDSELPDSPITNMRELMRGLSIRYALCLDWAHGMRIVA